MKGVMPRRSARLAARENRGDARRVSMAPTFVDMYHGEQKMYNSIEDAYASQDKMEGSMEMMEKPHLLESKEADLDEGGVMAAHIKKIMDTPGPNYLPKQMIFSKPAKTPAPIGRGVTNIKPHLSATYEEMLEDEADNQPERPLHCPAGHLMTKMTALPKGYEYAHCDNCEWRITKNKVFYHCEACEYDICESCKKTKDEVDDLPPSLPASIDQFVEQQMERANDQSTIGNSNTALYILLIIMTTLLILTTGALIVIVLIFPDELKERYQLCGIYLCKLSKYYKAAPVDTTWLDSIKATVQSRTHPFAHQLHKTFSPTVKSIIQKWEALPKMTENFLQRAEL